MNSVANGKVRRSTPFKRVYVQSAAGDAGGAIGAAMHVWHGLDVAPPRSAASVSALAGDVVAGRTVMDHAYLGPSAEDGEIEDLVAARAAELATQGCQIEQLADETELCRRTAAGIADGLVVGWFQGRMEWGPRALGNRSIVCDPRRADMKDVLNRKIKRRESFRPFAPSILREHVGEWFEEEDDVPFMMQVFQIREQKRQAHSGGDPRRWVGAATDRSPRNEPALPSPHRDVPGFDGCADGIEHLIQRERARCLPSRRGLGLLLEDKMDVLVLGDTMIERRGFARSRLATRAKELNFKC